MFVTNIRYGELPVRKVYLGEKLIWQCVEVQGETESMSYAKAYFHVPVLDAVHGDAHHKTYNNVLAHILELTLMKGKTESESQTRATVQLFENLLALGDSKNISNTSSSGTALDAILMGGSAQTETNDSVACRVFAIGNMKSKTEIKNNISAISWVIKPEPVGGDNISKFKVASTGGSYYILDTCGNTESNITTRAIASCWIPIKLKALAESNSSGSSTIFIFDSMPIGGNTSTKDKAEAVCKLFDLLLMGTDAKSNSHGEAVAILNDAILSNGFSKSIMCGDSIIKEYLLVLSKSDENINSNINASMVLWYPPIGDGIPLVESDGVDITINGDTLEIQQAYQIIIDEENGILEVI